MNRIEERDPQIYKLRSLAESLGYILVNESLVREYSRTTVSHEDYDKITINLKIYKSDDKLE